MNIELTPRRFAATLAVGLATFLGSTLGMNYFVDPYGIYSNQRYDGINQRKPEAYRHRLDAKAARYDRLLPQTVIIGNSRVDGGISPTDLAFANSTGSVFNYGLPGCSLACSVEQLLGRDTSRITRLIVGIDLLDFADLHRSVSADSGPVSARLAAPDFVFQLLSLDALGDSLATIAFQGVSDTDDMTEAGFNPWHAIETNYRLEGVALVFEQRNQENLDNYRNITHAYEQRPTFDTEQFEAIARLLEWANVHSTQLDFFIHPYHADILVGMDLAGLNTFLQRLKNQLVLSIQESPMRVGAGKRVSLWDFADYYDPNVETVPEPGDLETRMLWYYEAGHYTPALGHMVLARLYFHDDADPAFGRILLPSTLQPSEDRSGILKEEYHRRQPGAIDRMSSLWSRIARD